MAKTFHAVSAFAMTTRPNGRTRFIDRDATQAELRELNISSSKGVYVFAMSTGPGVTPWYVGKTARSFNSECFTDPKLLKYNQVVSAMKGKPYLYFLQLEQGRGKTNIRAIDELESLLIGIALKKNSRLLNLAKTKQYEITVQGILNSKSGKPKNEAIAFRHMIGLSKGVGLR